MHKAVLEFFREVKTHFPEKFVRPKVLELGSYDVNGSPRRFFENPEYVGVDWREGPLVDVVGFAHELGYPDETFSVVVSTEMFEHDCYAELSFTAALRMLKKDGLFVFTCANEKRVPHELCCGVDNYYRGVRKIDVLAWLLNFGEFSEFYICEGGEDLRGWILK